MGETLEQVNKEGTERLHPSLTNPSWLVLTQRRKLFEAWIGELPSGNLDVLDIGGRIQPYRPLLHGRPRRYVAVDMRASPLVDVIARAEQLPLRSDEFDLVICTQVLEYVPELRAVIAEIYRVLKPGGSLLLSMPAIFPPDSVQDLWRFTPASIRLLLSRFRDVEIRAEGSSIHGLFRTTALWIAYFARPALLARILRMTIIPLLNMTAVLLASILRTSNDQFAANFSAFARK